MSAWKPNVYFNAQKLYFDFIVRFLHASDVIRHTKRARVRARACVVAFYTVGPSFLEPQLAL